MTEWADEARTRQGLYRFIGAALLPPTGDRLEMLAAAYSVLDQRDLDRFAFSMSWRQFTRQFDHSVPVESLEVEHVRLFGTGMAGTPAMPTESFYRVPTQDGDMADFISSLEREYRSMGLVAIDGAEAPDHISTELETMSYLCGLEADAWESGQDSAARNTLQTELKFIKRHLGVWVPLFASAVQAADPLDFYRTLAALTHSFVVHESDYLASIPAPEVPA